MTYIVLKGFLGDKDLDLIRINILPPPHGKDRLSQLVITTAATRLVKSLSASPWEVFLCPDHAGRFAIHYHRPRRHNHRGRK